MLMASASTMETPKVTKVVVVPLTGSRLNQPTRTCHPLVAKGLVNT